MKERLGFILLMLLLLTGLSFCSKEEPVSGNQVIGLAYFLTTDDVSSITCESACSGGQIIENVGCDGSGVFTAQGVCWSTTPNPTTANNITIDKIHPDPKHFQAILTGLNSGTTYYVRAYATNSAGTIYGNELHFSTNPSVGPTVTATFYPPSISCTGVLVLGEITDDGCGALVPVIERGVCWATMVNPIIADNRGYVEKGPVAGSFRGEIDELQPATLYHVRPYFITSLGTFYGEDISFTTNPKPTVATAAVTELKQTTAKAGGNVTSTGGSFVVARGICYSTTPNPVLNGFTPFIEQEVQSFDGAGEFTCNLTNLTPGTLYYVRAFVYVMTGIEYGDVLTEYGNDYKFTTK
jgi:hypothetical protein